MLESVYLKFQLVTFLTWKKGWVVADGDTSLDKDTFVIISVG